MRQPRVCNQTQSVRNDLDIKQRQVQITGELTDVLVVPVVVPPVVGLQSTSAVREQVMVDVEVPSCAQHNTIQYNFSLVTQQPRQKPFGETLVNALQYEEPSSVSTAWADW